MIAADAAAEYCGASKNDADAFVLALFTPYRIVALGRVLSSKLGEAYRHEGLSIPEWRVLAVVAQSAATSARDVVALTPMDKMTVSRASQSLEDKGLVARMEDAADRRVSVLQLTPAGRALFDRVAHTATAFEGSLLSALTPEERAAFAGALAKLEARAASL